jgi:hypothetical protein
MRATLLCALAALAAAARAPGALPAEAPAAVAAVGAVVTETRSLPPFMNVEFGRAGCFPLSVRVAPGDSYALEVTAQARGARAARGRHAQRAQ